MNKFFLKRIETWNKKIYSRIRLAGFLQALVLVALSFEATASLASTPGLGCPQFPPTASLVLSKIYNDPADSIVNVEAEKKNKGSTEGVDKFLSYVEQALDKPSAQPGESVSDCAYKNFKQWSMASALLSDSLPYNSEGTLRRGQYLVAINIVAIKFKLSGFAIDANILKWLDALNKKNIDFYESASNRGNLRVWAAAAAALYTLISSDPRATYFQDRVWHEAISAIHEDGTISSEMSRGQRALIYHIYSLSATLVLRQARVALGNAESESERKSLKLLATATGAALCNPSLMAKVAGAVQEIPGDWAYRIVSGFGADLLDNNWKTCGLLKGDLNDVRWGGDTRRSADAIIESGTHNVKPDQEH